MKIVRSLVVLALLSPVMAMAQDKDAPAPAPMHTYRMTFTLIETENGKRVGVQHVAMTTSADGTSAVAKIGSRVPIATGSYSNTNSNTLQTQMTYLDIGLNILGRLREVTNGLQVKTKIEQSSMADAPPAMPSDPVIRQESIENDAVVTLGKPVTLGSLDIPGSTRHTDIELVVERVP
jgi:hypothetical protein